MFQDTLERTKILVCDDQKGHWFDSRVVNCVSLQYLRYVGLCQNHLQEVVLELICLSVCRKAKQKNKKKNIGALAHFGVI